MANCLHCGASALSAAFHDWFCLECGKRSGGVEVQNAQNGEHSEAVVESEGLDRRTDVRTPAADLPAATPTGLITGARPAAMTTTPELEGEKIAAKKAKDSTAVPAVPGDGVIENTPSDAEAQNVDVPPAPPSEAPKSGITSTSDLSLAAGSQPPAETQNVPQVVDSGPVTLQAATNTESGA